MAKTRNSPVTKSAVTTASVPLPGSRRFHRAGAQVLGRAAGEEWCDLTIKVRRKETLPEPVAGKAVARQDLLVKYGADPADLETVKRVLTAGGLTITSVNPAARGIRGLPGKCRRKVVRRSIVAG